MFLFFDSNFALRRSDTDLCSWLISLALQKNFYHWLKHCYFQWTLNLKCSLFTFLYFCKMQKPSRKLFLSQRWNHVKSSKDKLQAFPPDLNCIMGELMFHKSHKLKMFSVNLILKFCSVFPNSEYFIKEHMEVIK